MEIWETIIMKLTISHLRQIIQEELKAELKEYKVDTPKHFEPSQMPGTADDVFHDCINSVKKSFKKHDYKPYKGKSVEDAAAAICTDSRKEGGATLDWGNKRKKEVEKARPGGKTGKELDENTSEPGLGSSIAHGFLDIAGVVGDLAGGAGAIFDAANAALYIKEGDYLMAALSAISILPAAGDIVGKGTKLGILLSRMGKAAKAGQKTKVQTGLIGSSLKKAMPTIQKQWPAITKKLGPEHSEKMLQALKQITK